MQEGGEVDEYPELRTRRCERCAGIAKDAVAVGASCLVQEGRCNVTGVRRA
jgi:hypothetical protein